MKVLVKCLTCEKEELVMPNRAKRYKTCSKSCMAIMFSKERAQHVEKVCVVCGSRFNTKQSHLKRRVCCSLLCISKLKETMYTGKGNPNYGNTGDKCSNWGGGRFITEHGYVMLFRPEHPMSLKSGYILEHRLVMADVLSRMLTDDEIVHHKDENTQNNDVSNLEVMSLAEHTRLHNLRRPRNKDRLGRFIKEAKE